MTAIPDLARQVDTSTARRVRGRIPTPVAIVTGHGPKGPIGLTIGSLSMVSADPPLMNFFGMQESRTFAILRHLDQLSINVLDERHERVCLAFASSTGAQFDVGDWDMTCPQGPVLTSAVVSMTCEVETVYEAGDHIGVMVRLKQVAVSDKRPMVFYRGSMSRLHPLDGRKMKSQRFDWWEY